MTMINGTSQVIASPAPLRVAGLERPRVVAGPVGDAYRSAIDTGEPVLSPQSVYCDDRGWSLMNQLTGVMTAQGQINYSVQYPRVVKAWHRHAKQTDMWLCVAGNIKVGVHRESDGRSWIAFIGEKNPGVLIIPPSLWHGATVVGERSAGLLYYVTHAYDHAQPDEQRRPFDSILGFPWDVRHG